VPQTDLVFEAKSNMNTSWSWDEMWTWKQPIF
jgi:hypothetical protein